jgi:hypothetical protein
MNLRRILCALVSALLLSSCSPTAPVITPIPSPKPFVSPSVTSLASPTSRPKVETPTASLGDEYMVEATGNLSSTSRMTRQQVNIEFILDASGSMQASSGNKNRIKIAKEVLSELITRLPEGRNVGLRVYGHKHSSSETDKEISCADVELIVGVGPLDQRRFVSLLEPLDAKGWTPIAKSLELAANDMPAGEMYANHIILISDGEETCGGDPVAIARSVKSSSVGLTVHTISFAANQATKEQLQLVAQNTGGTYHEADDAATLLAALEGAVTTQKGTYLRGEVTGESGREVNTTISLRDPDTRRITHSFLTWLDAPVAPGTFDVIVGTAPRLIYRRVLIEGDNTFTVKAATGAVRFELTNADGSQVFAPVEMKEAKTGSRLRTFSTWANQTALPGKYDFQINTAPAFSVGDVVIESGVTRVISVGAAKLRVELYGMGGDRIKSLIELKAMPGSSGLTRNVSTWEDTQVVSGAYQLSFEKVLGKPRPSSFVIQGKESKVLKYASGLLRIDLTGIQVDKVPRTILLLDPSDRAVLGEFIAGQDWPILIGDYLVRTKEEPALETLVRVESAKYTVINLAADNR